MSIGHNPWNCTCEGGLQFKNSVKWIPVVSDLGNVTCVNDSQSNNITTIDLYARFENCGPEWRKSVVVNQSDEVNNALIIGLSVSLVALLLLGLVGYLCQRFKKFLRVWIYLSVGYG